MPQMVRCPLTGGICGRPNQTINDKAFFLAETEKPEKDRPRRKTAIKRALGEKYQVRSALDESQPHAFTCKICEMIQECAYGIADISSENVNVIFEIGVMVALGKPVIMLKRNGIDGKLSLPSDLRAIEIIPFDEYSDIEEPLRNMATKLPPPMSPSSPKQEMDKISPEMVAELNKKLEVATESFDKLAKEAKLDSISKQDEKLEIPKELKKQLNKLEDSLASLNKLGFATDTKTAFLRGNFHYGKEEYDLALEQYNWSLELGPDDPATLNNRSLTYFKLERYDEALTDLNKSLKIKPDDPTPLNNRGGTYIKLERYDEALADINKALEIKPDYADALHNRGLAYHNLERYDEALADFNKSLEIRPDHPAQLAGRGCIYAKLKQYGEALADFNKSLEIRPDHPGTTYNKACLFSLMNKANDAILWLEKAIKLDEKSRQDAKTDSDFENIRQDPRFKKLVEVD